MNTALRRETHKVDFCVVGGGLAGMLAAISAARHGAKVAIMQDRPFFGGNCSSEIRMWPLGAHGENKRETGIFEEILLENMYRNPTRNYSIWDSILFEKVALEKNITRLMNCSCSDLAMENGKIKSITGWQLTTYTWHTVEADYFADCSGDSILAPLCGAQHRIGREASSEYNEDIAPKVSDKKTMGMSCLIQATETDHKVTFTPPAWAHVYDENTIPRKDHFIDGEDYVRQNFWWLELGGENDSIHDTEVLRDELLKVAFGVWDHIKNRGDHNADNWELSWVGFLPGKRESRRYIGDHVLTQNEVRAEGKFEDLVAYGGWPMDDHHPAGLRYPGPATIFHPAPSPFGIPYRSLYSKNIENLFFAGRNISVTHTAMSSTRVMATCAIIGQAMGTAAAIAVKNKLSPRGVYEQKLSVLKQTLMDDDCYLPFNQREVSDITKNAALSTTDGDASALRNGIDRPIEEKDNGWYGKLGSFVELTFEKPETIKTIRFTFDSDLERESVEGHEVLRRYATLCNRSHNLGTFGFPKVMTKAFKVEYLTSDGKWELIKEEKKNYQRLYKIETDITAKAVRFTPTETWGAEKTHVFAFDVS